MSIAKGQGVTAYLRATTVTSVTSHVLCAIALDGGGIESDVVEVEPCLQDVDVARTTQDRKFTAITFQMKEQFSTASQVSSVISGLAGGTTDIMFIKRIPTTTPVFMSKTGRVVSFIPDAVDRGQDMTATVVIQPTSDWTSSTTAPAV